MKSAKKLIALILGNALVVSLAACGGQSAPTPGPGQSQQPSTSEPAQPAGGLVPAYSTDGFMTVDADGNRVITGRDATASNAMVSASKYEVSQVGAEIIAKGGNAIDAAVAMGFAIGVCEPFTNGIGGGGFATVRTAAGETYFVDFREIAPAQSTPEMYLDENGEVIPGATTLGGLASGIPGEVAGLLYMLENYGTMSRAEVMEPAIRIATEGFIVTRFAHEAIVDAYDKAVAYPEMQQVYWNEMGLPYETGTVINNLDMAKTLQIIADQGFDGFYKGEVAEAMVATVNKFGGIFTVEELANYKPTVYEPVTGTYKSLEIISSPPPSSGGTTMVAILNMLEQFDVGSMKINSTEYVHLWTEIYKLAYADRARYMADTQFTDVPLTGLASKEYAKERAALIDMSTAAHDVAFDDPWRHETPSTTHYSIADKEGNMVSVTKTINYYFGSGVMVDGYGFMMNNEMDDFSTNPESVNRVEPGKKPLSSMTPTIILKDGQPHMVIGTPGGPRIFATVAQVLSRVVDHGMSLNEAIGVPRIWNTTNIDRIHYEEAMKGFEDYAITPETIAELIAMGHNEPSTMSSGAVQAILFQPDGELYGTADPRQDGKAVGN